MTTTVVLDAQPLTQLVVDELGHGKRILVVIDGTDDALAWRAALGRRILEAWAPARTRHRSSGFHTIELIGNGYVDVLTRRTARGGAARGRQYDLVALPLDVETDERLCAAVLPSAAAGDARVLRHSVGA